MDWDKLNRTLSAGSGSYTIVRPGIALWFTYAVPLAELGPSIAETLEHYLAFVPPNSMDHYLAKSGVYKRFTLKYFDDLLEHLRNLDDHTEFFGFHFGQGPGGSVGTYGVHFSGSNLNHADSMPLETNLLMLEFPVEQLQHTTPDDFVRFSVEVAKMAEINSGIGGYAFKHPQRIFRSQAIEAIARMALRYIGFDINYDSIQLEVKGHIHNVSWLTFLGRGLVEDLGGLEEMRAALPAEMDLIPLDNGVMIRAAVVPMVGDVNRGAPDIAPLRALAAFAKPIRVETEYLGSDDELFAQRWLSRLD